MKTVLVQNDYSVRATRLWKLATDYQALTEIMEGLATLDGLPIGRAQTGQRLDVMVSLFGKLPKQPYCIEVLECDDAQMILRTSERGSGVKEWRHTLTVIETATGSRLCDQIEIDAGLLTPLFALWAKFLYGARHPRRLRLLESKRY